MNKADVASIKEALGFGARLFKGFKDGEDLFEKLDSLGNYEAELQKSIDGLVSARDKYALELEQARDAVVAAKSEAADIVANTKAREDDMLRKAKEEANKIVTEAQDKAESLYEGITESAERLEALRQEYDALSEEMKKLEKAKADALARFTDALKA